MRCRLQSARAVVGQDRTNVRSECVGILYTVLHILPALSVYSGSRWGLLIQRELDSAHAS